MADSITEITHYLGWGDSLKTIFFIIIRGIL